MPARKLRVIIAHPKQPAQSANYGDSHTQSYTVDPMGNRLSKVNDGVTENYSYNNANMLLTRGANNYTNDLDGNTLTGGGRTNTWDSQNRLITCVNGANTSNFTYAADGIRRRSLLGANTTDFICDGPIFVREKLNGVVAATYLVGPRGPEYRRDDVSGQIRWYVFDGLGSALGECDPSGNLTATRSYDVYGSVRTSSGTSTSKHKFAGNLGHPSEDETGLVYMRARFMDPVVGRFIKEDPAKHGGNWYAYAENSPVNFVDATGKVSDLMLLLSEIMRTIDSALGLSVYFQIMLKSIWTWFRSVIQSVFGAEQAAAIAAKQAQAKEGATGGLVGLAEEAEASRSMIGAAENLGEALEAKAMIEYIEATACDTLEEWYMSGRVY